MTFKFSRLIASLSIACVLTTSFFALQQSVVIPQPVLLENIDHLLAQAIQPINPTKNKHLYWDWDSLDTTVLKFPGKDTSGQPFLWGFGTSSLQVDGHCINSAWSYTSPWFNIMQQNWAKEGNTFVDASAACDHWNRYKEDIQLLADIGCNAYRFSMEWAKIEPQPGIFNEQALDHYVDVCNELLAHGIKPVITLHHYSDPIWFLKKGGFEKKENNKYFVEFCKYVFAKLHDKVHLWLTFNSPSGYAMKGYWKAATPPCKHNMQLAMEVLRNMCFAHVDVYHELKAQLKAINPNATTRIGILKNIYQLDPWNKSNPIDRLKAGVGNKLTNNCMYNFFSTGKFKVHIPCWVNVQGKDTRAPQSLDFIGLNYYSHAYCSAKEETYHPKWEEKTGCAPNWHDKYFIYPTGLYRAIKELSDNVAAKLNIPIYITENGIGTNDDAKRVRHNRKYLYALSQAIQDGYNVRGYLQWSLLDNYEWGSFNKSYGAFHVNFDKSSSDYLKRTLKPGAVYYCDVIRTYNTALQADAKKAISNLTNIGISIS